jgi:hypothetical protein
MSAAKIIKQSTDYDLGSWAQRQAEHEEKVRGIQEKVTALETKLNSPEAFSTLFRSHIEQSVPLNECIAQLMVMPFMVSGGTGRRSRTVSNFGVICYVFCAALF